MTEEEKKDGAEAAPVLELGPEAEGEETRPQATDGYAMPLCTSEKPPFWELGEPGGNLEEGAPPL